MRPDPRSIEYPSILKRAAHEGWLRELVAAHLTPCDQLGARRLIAGMRLFWKPELPRNLQLRWGSKRGRARFNLRTREYGISLPSIPLDEGGRLRAGLVLHEAAHIIDRMQSGTFGHGPKYCQILRDLVTKSYWRIWQMAPHENMREIYARHRGPFTLMVTREREDGKKKVQVTEALTGSYTAEEAHEEARLLIKGTKEIILDAFVFSATEGQFIGAVYKRGEEYMPWSQMRDAIVQMAAEAPEPAEEPAPKPADVDDLAGHVHPAELPPVPADAGTMTTQPLMEAAKQAMAPKVKKPREAPAPRKRVALEIDPSHADRWPNTEAAQLVRAEIEAAGKISASDLAERIRARATALGVAHPASLISRLKQAGFLREAE